MHLLQCLFFCEAHYQFHLSAVYLPGAQNTLADDLSHDHRSQFLLKAPGMSAEPSQPPPRLPKLLLGEGNWTSQAWTGMFISLLFGASQTPPPDPISQE